MADGSDLRAAPSARHRSVGHRADLARAAVRGVRLGDAQAARRARGAPARHRPRGGGRVLRAQPVHGDVHGPHQPDPARVLADAVAAAGDLPRRALPERAAQLDVGRGVRPHPRLLGRRDQRRRGRLDAGRPAGAARLRDADRHDPMARLGPVPRARRRPRSARVALVDHAAGRPCRLRHRLPAVHRAAAHDLGDQQRLGGAAPDGVLDLVHGRGLQRPRPALLHRGRHDAVQPARGGRVAAAAGAGGGGLRLDAAAALRAVLPLPAARRRGDRRGRLPGGHAEPRDDGVDLPQRAARALHAHDPEGGAARGDGDRRPARPRRPGAPGSTCAPGRACWCRPQRRR